mmetsp:Transcript_15922/g.26789  ORF Transcript_15922/g.26789 Transcript_15922/m.26789 type:complete len:206 (-) Transcript_15922:1663-2280(-)
MEIATSTTVSITPFGRRRAVSRWPWTSWTWDCVIGSLGARRRTFIPTAISVIERAATGEQFCGGLETEERRLHLRSNCDGLLNVNHSVSPGLWDDDYITSRLHTCNRRHPTSSKIVHICFVIIQNLLIAHYHSARRINDPFFSAIDESIPCCVVKMDRGPRALTTERPLGVHKYFSRIHTILAPVHRGRKMLERLLKHGWRGAVF